MMGAPAADRRPALVAPAPGILVLNAGSSSLKLGLFDAAGRVCGG